MDPFIGEIKMFAGDFAPTGYALCNGQLMSIAQNSALFALLGTTYGGNGQTTFALPDLRGRVPINPGSGPGLSPYQLGQSGGTENVTLQVAQIPMHNHPFAPPSNSSSQATTNPDPTGSFPGNSGANNYAGSSDGSMGPGTTGVQGGNQQHPNIQPYVCVNFIIALQGIFPSRP